MTPEDSTNVCTYLHGDTCLPEGWGLYEECEASCSAGINGEHIYSPPAQGALSAVLLRPVIKG